MHEPLTRRTTVAAIGLSVGLFGINLTADTASAGESIETHGCRNRFSPRGESDVWAVSTRSLPRICRPVFDADFRVERRDAPGHWNSTTVDALVATDRPVVFFIHGNRYDSGSAKRDAVKLARRLDGCRPDCSPVRTVVFSWPSDTHGRPLREARDNFVRAEADGHYFGGLLSKFPQATELGIISYSFGSKIALVGLDDLHAAEPVRTGRLALVLVTPAIRFDSLAPGGRHRGAILSIDRLTMFTNPRDEALRFFPLVEPSRVAAAGYVGIPSTWVPDDVAFSQVDASPIVGKEHSMRAFIDSRTLSCRIAAGAID